jgi:hypothetical protein
MEAIFLQPWRNQLPFPPQKGRKAEEVLKGCTY